MNEFFVYIIYSSGKEIYYKGYTQYPEKRLSEHNQGLSRYTKGKGPWELVYLEKFNSKKEALQRERQIKRVNTKYLRWLIQQKCNLLND
jgi:putative endonuclease